MSLTIPIPRELNTYYQIQNLFSSPIILIYFYPKLRLFINLNASKEWEFGVYVYHIEGLKAYIPIDDIPRQKSRLPIVFLSRLLTDAETRYWPTELEVARLV